MPPWAEGRFSTVESFRKWRAGAIISGIALSIILVVLALWGFNPQGATQSSIVPTAPPTPSATPTPPPPVDLAVTQADLAAATAPCASDKFNTNSMPNKDLVLGDSVSTRFTASLVANQDYVGMMNEFMSEDCGNLTLIDMAIHGLATLPVDQTHTARDVNSWWMDEYFAKIDSGKTLRELFLTKKAGEGNKLFVTADFQKYASLTNLLLARVKPVAMDASRSLSNYYVPARSGLAAGEIPVTELNPQPESRMAIWMGYTLKSGSCTNIEFGFNVLDKRFETRATCVITPPTTTCKTTNSCTTTHTPGCTSNCSPPVKTCVSVYGSKYPNGLYPVCKDGEGNLPSNQGHNRPGGGGPAPVQTDPVGPPAAGTPPVTYTPAPVPAPAPTSTPIGSTPAPSPTATPPNEGGTN